MCDLCLEGFKKLGLDEVHRLSTAVRGAMSADGEVGPAALRALAAAQREPTRTAHEWHQHFANQLHQDVEGVAPDGYAIALAKRHARSLDRSTTDVIRDANGIPDGYATALARKENRNG
jgi:hypothetical protein